MSEVKPTILVAIVEDDPILREALTRAVEVAAELQIAGVAGDVASAQVLLREPLDVLLIDLALPDGNGVDVIRGARARGLTTLKIIVVSIFGDAHSVVRAIEAGADGYLLKGGDPVEAASAIRSVLEGGAPISPAVASHILARIRERGQAPNPANTTLLTEKEIAILTDLAKGFRYKEVARLHVISPHTVADHVKSIYRKLAVNSRSEAVFEAVQAGLIEAQILSRPFENIAQFDATPVRTWPLAILIVAMQVVFCAALVWINSVAENVPGRRVADVLIANSAVASIESAADFSPARLARETCCARPGAVIRTTLTETDAALTAPTVLIVSAHDNAHVYLNGELIGGQGELGANMSLLGGVPILVRLPKRLAVPGARLEIVVQRAVGVAHLQPFNVGDYHALYPAYLALRVLRFDLLFLNAAFGAFLAGLCFCAAPLFGARGLLVSLGCLGASWTLQHVGLLLSDATWGPVANNGLYYAAYLSTLLCSVWFFVNWTSVFANPVRENRGWRHVISFMLDPWPPRALQLLGIASAASVALGAALIAQRLTYDLPGASHAINVVIGWLGLVAMTFCFVRIAAFYLRTGLRNPIEAAAFLFVVIAAFVDIASVRFFGGSGVFLGAAVTFFPLALLVSLAARARGVFEAATATAEQLNVLVAARESEILAGMGELQKRERDSMLLEERSRIMRDMHDGIGGQLLGMILQARSNKLSSEGMISGLEESLSDLRMVVDSLDQTEGSLATLLGAFRARIEPRCEAMQTTLNWQIGDVGPTPNIGPDKILQIYRILQEACTNALAHGRPKNITVSLCRAAPGHVEIVIADDGAGFDAAVAPSGRGLSNMRARAQRIGAHLTVSGAASGARVALDIET